MPDRIIENMTYVDLQILLYVPTYLQKICKLPYVRNVKTVVEFVLDATTSI